MEPILFMKVCAISDIHGDLNITIPECDVLCICGDIIPITIQRDNKRSSTWWFNTFIPWVKDLPCTKVIATPGNHDFFLEPFVEDTKAYNDFVAKTNTKSDFKLIILINEVYTYNSVTFYGCPYIRPIGFSKWAFEDGIPRITMVGEEYIDKWYEYGPKKVDILLTHDNPFKNDYLLWRWSGNYKYWFCGHWHDGEDDPNQNIYNVSVLDDYYNRKSNYKVITIDTEDGEETG